MYNACESGSSACAETPSDASAVIQWYALSTRSRHEMQVRDRLAAIGAEPLLPLTKSLRQWSDRKVWTMTPLFSGYCFARFSLMNRLAILQLPGVVRIVGTNNPEAIPDEEMAAILKLTASERHLESHDYFDPYVEGAWVDVIQGPLAGIRGQLVRKGKHHCLIIRAHLIQRAAIVHVDMSEVRPVNWGAPPIAARADFSSIRAASCVNAK